MGNSSKTKISLFEKIIYGSGDIGLNAMYTLFSSYVLFFYTNVIGMNAAIIGTVILISKIFDGISDLIAGQIIDTHKSKRGHCIPVILKWTIPMLVAITLVFLVPESTVAVRVAFVFVTYNLFNTIVYTYVCSAHCTLASYVTNDPQERSQMMVYKMMFAALTQTVMANVILPMVEFFGGQNSQSAWIKAVLVFGGIGAIFLFLNKSANFFFISLYTSFLIVALFGCVPDSDASVKLQIRGKILFLTLTSYYVKNKNRLYSKI